MDTVYIAENVAILEVVLLQKEGIKRAVHWSFGYVIYNIIRNAVVLGVLFNKSILRR